MNHSEALSGPVVMSWGELAAVGVGNSVITPAVVMRPILLPPLSGKPQRAVRPRSDACG